jgi:hypothetical protein
MAVTLFEKIESLKTNRQPGVNSLGNTSFEMPAFQAYWGKPNVRHE